MNYAAAHRRSTQTTKFAKAAHEITPSILRPSRVLWKQHGAVFDLLPENGPAVHTWNNLDRRGVLQDLTPNLRCSEAPTRCVKSLQVGKCEIMYSLMFYEDSYICIYSHAVKIFCIPQSQRRYPDKMQLHRYASFLCHLRGIQAHIWFSFTRAAKYGGDKCDDGHKNVISTAETEFLLFICIPDVKEKTNNILTPAAGIHFQQLAGHVINQSSVINVSLSVRKENVLVLDQLQSAGKSLAKKQYIWKTIWGKSSLSITSKSNSWNHSYNHIVLQ